MQKKQLLIIALFILITLSCSNEKPNTIIGNWEGEDVSGNKQEFIFYDNSIAIWKISTLVGNETYHLKYFIDESTSPYSIQIYGFEKGFLFGKTVYGIFKIENENTFYLDANLGESAEIRPTDFTDQTVKFKRIIANK